MGMSDIFLDQIATAGGPPVLILIGWLLGKIKADVELANQIQTQILSLIRGGGSAKGEGKL